MIYSQFDLKLKLATNSTFQEPYFTSIDFKEDSDFAPTVTDSGLCHILNGPPIGAVFAPSERIGQLGCNSIGI